MSMCYQLLNDSPRLALVHKTTWTHDIMNNATRRGSHLEVSAQVIDGDVALVVIVQTLESLHVHVDFILSEVNRSLHFRGLFNVETHLPAEEALCSLRLLLNKHVHVHSKCRRTEQHASCSLVHPDIHRAFITSEPISPRRNHMACTATPRTTINSTAIADNDNKGH